jgi:hypothetical protein
MRCGDDIHATFERWLSFAPPAAPRTPYSDSGFVAASAVIDPSERLGVWRTL